MSWPSGRLSNVVSIAAGASHNLALRADGTVVASGLNTDGQTNVPAGLTNVVAISAGQNFSMALIGNGPPLTTAMLTSPASNTKTFWRELAEPERKGLCPRV